MESKLLHTKYLRIWNNAEFFGFGFTFELTTGFLVIWFGSLYLVFGRIDYDDMG